MNVFDQANRRQTFDIVDEAQGTPTCILARQTPDFVIPTITEMIFFLQRHR